MSHIPVSVWFLPLHVCISFVFGQTVNKYTIQYREQHKTGQIITVNWLTRPNHIHRPLPPFIRGPDLVNVVIWKERERAEYDLFPLKWPVRGFPEIYQGLIIGPYFNIRCPIRRQLIWDLISGEYCWYQDSWQVDRISWVNECLVCSQRHLSTRRKTNIPHIRVIRHLVWHRANRWLSATVNVSALRT